MLPTQAKSDQHVVEGVYPFLLRVIEGVTYRTDRRPGAAQTRTERICVS